MKRTLLALLALAVPGLAYAGGGGGAFAEAQYLPRYGPRAAQHEAPGWVRCLGGVGYGVTSGNLRVGGEGAWCSGSDGDVRLSYGGAQLGAWTRPGWIYWSFYSSLGFGTLTDRKVLDVQERPYQSVFFYAKPTLAMGLPLGFLNVELGLFAQLPVNLVQLVGTGEARGFVTPSLGAQVAVLFGDLRDPRKTREERYLESLPPPPAHPPPAGPPPVAPPQGVAPSTAAPYPPPPVLQDGCEGRDGPDCVAPCEAGNWGPDCEEGQAAPQDARGDDEVPPLAIPVD